MMGSKAVVRIWQQFWY